MYHLDRSCTFVSIEKYVSFGQIFVEFSVQVRINYFSYQVQICFFFCFFLLLYPPQQHLDLSNNVYMFILLVTSMLLACLSCMVHGTYS